jgi:hypothetical protein
MQTPPRFPPRLVPTLTDIVDIPDEGSAAVSIAPVSPVARQPDGLQEQLIQGVMLRVDAILSKRLHDAVAELVHTHIGLMAPVLHQQIEVVVREAVVEALAASHSAP